MRAKHAHRRGTCRAYPMCPPEGCWLETCAVARGEDEPRSHNQDHATGFCACGLDEFLAPGRAYCPVHDYMAEAEVDAAVLDDQDRRAIEGVMDEYETFEAATGHTQMTVYDYPECFDDGGSHD